MAQNSLAKKLQIKAGQRLLLLNPPLGYQEQLAPLPEGVEIVEEPAGQFDGIQVFIKSMAELQQLLPTVIPVLKYDALLWIAYPKGSAKAGKDVNRDSLWATVAEYQLTGVSLISLDDTWSAMRFRPAEKVKQA